MQYLIIIPVLPQVQHSSWWWLIEANRTIDRVPDSWERGMCREFLYWDILDCGDNTEVIETRQRTIEYLKKEYGLHD